MVLLLCTTLYLNLICWEDFKVGAAADLGQHTFIEDEIVAFARQFDPQPFRTDKVAAQESVFARCASPINKSMRASSSRGLLDRKN